jgi:hypothetical protein
MTCFEISLNAKRTYIAALVICIACVAQCRAFGDSSRTIEDLAKAWADREKTCQTVHFEILEEDSTRTDRLPPDVLDRLRQTITNLGESLDTVTDASMDLSGEKFSIRSTAREADKVSKPAGMRAAYNGTISQYYSGTSSPRSFGTGEVTSQKHAFRVRALSILPVVAGYRGLHPTLGAIDLKKHRLGTDRVAVGEYSCLILEEVTDGKRARKYWVDPDNSFVIRHYEHFVNAQKLVQIDIAYSTDAKYGPVPTSWSYQDFDKSGDVAVSLRSTVKVYEINLSIPDSEFEIHFPRGTHVHDRRTGRQFRSKGSAAGTESGDLDAGQ